LSHLADEELLARINRNDAAAFEELYEKYSSRIYEYCVRLLHNHEHAEDVVQETLAKVFTQARSVQDPHSFQGWIFTVARNEAFGILRRMRTEEIRNDDQLWESETPLDSLLQAEESEIVQHLLGDLKAEYREVLLLREYEGFSYEEIASISSSTVGSVRSRLFKARKALTKKLQQVYQVRR
jgi:RNA polymerase sigma-70 factor (ECF subfamily)